MNTSRSRLSFTVTLLALAVACSTNNSGSTTGVANGSGATGASNGTGGTGTGSGSSGGSPTGGATTGPQDPIGKVCAKTGNGDYNACSTSLDCQCPLLCGLDPVLGLDDAGGSICVMPCATTADCPDVFTSCQNGLCTTNICEADGGGGAFFGPCDALGSGDGMCEPVVDAFDNVFGACFQAGTSKIDGGCDSTIPPFALANAGNKVRPAPASLCPVGYACDTSSVCEALCDPVVDQDSEGDAGGCSEGSCVTLLKNTIHGGHCEFQGDGGCLVGAGGQELDHCTLPSECECPLDCRVDPGSVRAYCEKECTDTVADCDYLNTSCQKMGTRSFCNPNYCVQSFFGLATNPDAGSSKYFGPCNYAGQGDGVCQLNLRMDQNGTPLNTYGFCLPAGSVTVGGSCMNPPFCAVNDVCINPGTCFQACDPLSDGGCPAGDGCFTVIPYGLPQLTGFCNACAVGGTGCINSSECCDGFCDFNVDAGTGTCN